MGHTDEQGAVGDKHLLEHIARQLPEHAANRRPRAIHPGAERDIAGMVVPEFMCEDGLQLLDGHCLHQEQSNAHHPPAANAQDAAPSGHEGIHVTHDEHIGWHRLVGRMGHLVDGVEQGGLVVLGDAWAGRYESVAPRNSAPQNQQPAASRQHQKLGASDSGVNHFGIGQPEQPDAEAQRQQVEARHQHQRERDAGGHPDPAVHAPTAAPTGGQAFGATWNRRCRSFPGRSAHCAAGRWQGHRAAPSMSGSELAGRISDSPWNSAQDLPATGREGA